MPIKSAQVVAAARSWIDTPFLHQGRVKGRGLDCVGLPLMVAEELGLADINGKPLSGSTYCEYDPQPVGMHVQDICFLHLKLKPLRTLAPGDIVTLRNGSEPCHLAIIGERKGRLTLIHAYRGVVEKVIEQDLDIKWTRRLSNCFSFPGVED